MLILTKGRTYITSSNKRGNIFNINRMIIRLLYSIKFIKAVEDQSIKIEEDIHLEEKLSSLSPKKSPSQGIYFSFFLKH